MSAACLLVACGCRREDVRTFTVEIPDLSEANKDRVVEALKKYNGVRKDTYQWDFAAKTLTFRYDSMQLAEENVRQAIEAAKLTVRRKK